MKRKEFIKKSSTILAGGLIAPIASCTSESSQVDSNTSIDPNPVTETAADSVRTNWAGNYTYQAPQVHYPKTVEEVQKLVKELSSQKALGSCHCFNNIADSPINQISTKNLYQVASLDKNEGTVTVGAGIKYGELAPYLEQEGYALHNLASLPHISVAGACATATHGSGVGNGNLATAVTALDLVIADGTVVTLNTDDPEFYGAVAGLGALGIVTQMTLKIEPSYQVTQNVFQDLPLESLTEHFDEIMSSGYSVSLFTDWMDQKISQVWVKRRGDHTRGVLGKDFFGARAADRNLHPITELSAEPCTGQLGNPGAWHDRLPHFKMGFTPSSGDELQSEYFVAREHAVEAILALEKKRELINPHLFITEIRTIAADDLWMSTAYQRESVAIHFTWKPHADDVQKLMPIIEAELAPFDVRPHWGKLFTVDPQILRSRYPKYDEFVTLAKSYDPQGKFRNSYLDLNIFG